MPTPAIAPAASPSHHTPPPPPPSSQTRTVIEPVSFRGRTISSLRRAADAGHYVLLDAVCRVFFPNQRNVDGFIRAADALFHIPDVRMSAAEQAHFIGFYRLPTDRLTHDRLIRLDQLGDIFPGLERMFACEVGVADGQLIGTVIPRPPADTSSSHTAASQATPTTTTATTNSNNNNNNGEEVKRRRKRRRNVCTEVVVID